MLDDFDHLSKFEIEFIRQRVAEIVDAMQVLEHSLLICRPVKSGKRELVIGSGSRGYVALYRFVATINTVFVLAIDRQTQAPVDHVLERPHTFGPSVNTSPPDGGHQGLLRQPVRS